MITSRTFTPADVTAPAEPSVAGPVKRRRRSDDADEFITALYRAHRSSLLRMAILLVDDQQSAEDAVHEAFFGLYRQFSTLAERTSALAYLRRAVVNNCRSTLRRRTARAYIPPFLPDSASAESMALLSQEHSDVLAALRRLAPRQRCVLVLRYYENFSEAEIAEITGLTRGAVKSTASRALDVLERRLAQ